MASPSSWAALGIAPFVGAVSYSAKTKSSLPDGADAGTVHVRPLAPVVHAALPDETFVTLVPSGVVCPVSLWAYVVTDTPFVLGETKARLRKAGVVTTLGISSLKLTRALVVGCGWPGAVGIERLPPPPLHAASAANPHIAKDRASRCIRVG